MADETVRLADGEARQALVPGVAPVPQVTRDLAFLQARRSARRGSAPPPCGGLFDEEAQRQGQLL